MRCTQKNAVVMLRVQAIVVGIQGANSASTMH
jgi:hypothetical protein